MKILIGLIIIACLGISAYSLNVILKPPAHQVSIKEAPATAVASPSKGPNVNADKLFEIIQEWRTSENLQPYVKDERLCKIAEDRVLNDKFLDDHEGLFRKYSNYPYVISENLNYAISEKAMLDGWLNSPEHAQALRKPYTHSCIYCYNGYCSQIFSSFLKN